MALVGRGVRGAGRGTAGALKVRVKAMRSVPSIARRLATVGDATEVPQRSPGRGPPH